MLRPLRLVLYDATQRARAPRLLGYSWTLGAPAYRAFGGIDASFGATNFAEAFTWLARVAPDRPIGELQFWGHGKWGRILLARESLDRSALDVRHPLRPKLEALRERLTPEALLWFRTCETAGARPGQDFARALSDFTGARVAGHTFVIGFFQSGLHVLAPGMTPTWDPREGLAAGTPERPERALSSHPSHPGTVTCLTARLPAAFATDARAG